MLVLRFFIILLCCCTLLSCLDQSDNTQPSKTDVVITNNPETQQSTQAPSNERTSWQKPILLLDKLGDLSNKTVADIGAGTGYFAFQLVHRAEKVLAIEIDTNMIHLIEAFKSTMSDENQQKLETRLAKPNDPLVKQSEVDVALFVNVIAYIGNRTEYLSNLRKKLKAEGQLMIVDFKVKRLPIDAPPYNERVLMHIIEEELYQAGFKEVVIDDKTLDYQYIIQAR